MSVAQQEFFMPTFLLWLEKFRGVWQQDSVRIRVERREDGCLTCRNLDGAQQPLIDFFCPTWVKVESPPGPLGFPPAILSKPLMSHWLGVKETQAWQAAVNTGKGREYLLRKFETAIDETPLEIRELKWVTWWRDRAENYPDPMSEDDLAAHQALYERFRRAEVD